MAHGPAVGQIDGFSTREPLMLNLRRLLIVLAAVTFGLAATSPALASVGFRRIAVPDD